MEEYVGKIWHNAISKFSDHRFTDATVYLADLTDRLSLQYRALGGHASTQLMPTQRTLWTAKPSLLSRFANVGDKTELAWKNSESIRLPSEISVFPTKELNQKLYLWLLVLLRVSKEQTNWLIDNQIFVKQVLKTYPGMQSIYSELLEIHLEYRKNKAYVRKEVLQEEQLVCQALQNPGSVSDSIKDPLLLPPVPLWLHPITVVETPREIKKNAPEQEHKNKGVKQLKEKHRRKGEMVDDPDGRSGLMAFRLESYFSWSEFINLDRTADDSKEDSAQKAADDMDVISISESSDTMASRVRFDLDLPASQYDDITLLDGILLPEWDYQKQQLVQDYCALKIMLPKGAIPSKTPEHLSKQVRYLKAQFERLKPEKHWLKNQQDGSELDLDNVIRYQTDINRKQVTKIPGLFKSLQHNLRDLSCLLLADLSLSTDAWVNNDGRVIDVIRDSLFLFSEALEVSGDNYAISGFSSVKRNNIRYYQLKTFSEKLNDQIRGNIKAIEPGYYTRMGAAIRQATKQLLKQATGQRLLLILTDGKPNDIDRYEGRYGIEDTRKSIQQARASGLEVFCITIDENANQYLPYLFGKNHYILVKQIKELPNKLLKLYTLLTG